MEKWLNYLPAKDFVIDVDLIQAVSRNGIGQMRGAITIFPFAVLTNLGNIDARPDIYLRVTIRGFYFTNSALTKLQIPNTLIFLNE